MGSALRSVIATMVFPETVPLAKMLIKSLRPRTMRPIILFVIGCDPLNLGEDRRVVLDMDKLWSSLHDRKNRGVNDKAKSIMFHALQNIFGVEEVLYLDADCLVLQPIDDVFRFRGGLFMAREELWFYEEYLKAMECPIPTLTFNAGVILFRIDCTHWWGPFYERLCDKFDEENHPHVEGQTTWNVVWQKHLGESAVLPQRYNQLHVKHGPHGAVVYHMAGLSQNMKLPVMQSCYRQFFGEEP